MQTGISCSTCMKPAELMGMHGSKRTTPGWAGNRPPISASNTSRKIVLPPATDGGRHAEGSQSNRLGDGGIHRLHLRLVSPIQVPGAPWKRRAVHDIDRLARLPWA